MGACLEQFQREYLPAPKLEGGQAVRAKVRDAHLVRTEPTARIERRLVLGGLISEYHRAA